MQNIVNLAMKSEASTSWLRLYYYYQQPSYLMTQTQTNREPATCMHASELHDSRGKLMDIFILEPHKRMHGPCANEGTQQALPKTA